jgi:hypothetical protein
MRQMAARLGIDVDEHRWPRLVRAATFESMRSRAGTTVPGGGPEHWIDPTAFFARGTSGQWRDLLDDADLARYAARVRALASDNLSGDWWGSHWRGTQSGTRCRTGGALSRASRPTGCREALPGRPPGRGAHQEPSPRTPVGWKE